MAPLAVLNAGIAGQWTLQVRQKAAQSLAGLFSPCVAETTLPRFCKAGHLLLTLLGSMCQVASSAVRAVAGVLASGYAAVEMLMGSLGVRLPLHVCASAVLADTCMLSDPRTNEATVTNCEHMSK